MTRCKYAFQTQRVGMTRSFPTHKAKQQQSTNLGCLDCAVHPGPARYTSLGFSLSHRLGSVNATDELDCPRPPSLLPP